MKRVNKDELVKKLTKKLNKSPREIKDVVESIFDEISISLQQGDQVHVVGFGKFTTRTRKERVGRDPNTGKTLQLPKTVTTCFLASKNLVKSVKKNLA